MRLSHDSGIVEPFMPGHVRSCCETNLSVNDLDCVFSESAIRGERCMNGAGCLLCLWRRNGLSALHVKAATRRCGCPLYWLQTLPSVSAVDYLLGALLVA